MSAAADAVSHDIHVPFARPEATERKRSLERLESDLTELWGHINAASYRFLVLLAEFDGRKGYEAHGLASSAQWLNWQCGVSDHAAREKVRVARALEFLPAISDAFRRGLLSYSKVRALTRVARPEDEPVLLNAALSGTAAHVERLVRKFRRCERRGEAQAAHDRHRSRYLNIHHDDDGTVVIHAVLPPEAGALVEKALEAALEMLEEPAESEAAVDAPEEPERGWTHSNVPAETPSSPAERSGCVEGADVSAHASRVPAEPSDVPAHTSCAPARTLRVPADETPEAANDVLATPRAPFGARRADALHLLAEMFLSRRTESTSAVADRFQVAVHIDQRLLARRTAAHTSAAGTRPADAALHALDADVMRRCELESSDAPLAIETARRLACDASLVGIVDDEHGTPLDVGRRTRAIPPALQRALRARDGGCRFPGCGRSRYTQGHHIMHWADGGETKLSNLVLLCRHHHGLVHEGGFGLHARDDCAERDRLVFTRPDGSRVEPNGRLPVRAARVTAEQTEPPLFELNRRAGLAIDAETSRGEWLGERFDYGTAIETMQYCRTYERTAESLRYDARCRERQRERNREQQLQRINAPRCSSRRAGRP